MTRKGLELNVMIEGQEGLTWERWQRLARAAEDGGFGGLYRSDHLTGLFGDPTRPSLETWASLPWVATATKRIRFGPIVSPLTFYQPALLAKQAAAIDQLSGGRFDLGIGAGWNEMEHRMFGIPFPPLRERMDRLECGARAIRQLWRGTPVTLDQPYAPLVEAQSFPLPTGVRLIVGGRGERRTMRVAAELADEWNVTRVTFDEYPRKLDVLAGHCRAVGRDPATIRAVADGPDRGGPHAGRGPGPAGPGPRMVPAGPGARGGVAGPELPLRLGGRGRARPAPLARARASGGS